MPAKLGPALPVATLLPADRRWERRRIGSSVLRVEVANPANQRLTEPLEVLVDLALVHSIVPTAVLERLEIRPWGEKDFLVTDGKHIRRKVGGVLLKYRDSITFTNIIFSEEGGAARLGILALEALGFALDSVQRREPKPGSERPHLSDLQ